MNRRATPTRAERREVGSAPAVRSAVAGAVLAAAILATTSCAALSPDVHAAGDTASEFAGALTRQDAPAACALLAPDTRSAVESGGRACAHAILGEDLPRAGAVVESAAYGRGAQVALRGDVVFLARFGDRWLITAAGCRPRGDDPYDCTVSRG